MNKSALMVAVCFSLGLFALGGCGDTSAGETLDVVAEPNAQPTSIRGLSPYELSPRVIYRGEKELGYEWSVVSHDGGIFIDGVNTKNAKITCSGLGRYKLKFRVYESTGGISVTDEANYVVSSLDSPALQVDAEPGAEPVSVRGNEPYQLTPAVSYNGTAALTYQWAVIVGGGEDVLLSDSAVKNPDVRFRDLGSYQLRLTVRTADGFVEDIDNALYSVTEFAPVSVVVSANSPLLTYPVSADGAPGTGFVNLTAAMTGGNGRSYNVVWSVTPDAGNGAGTPSFRLNHANGPTEDVNSAASVVFFGGAAGGFGAYQVRCQVTDANGQTATANYTILVSVGDAG